MTNTSKVIVGVAAAAAAGAVIGMMFAPEKGSAMREKVREAANGLATDLLDAYQRTRNQAANAVENTVDSAQNTVSELKDKAADKFSEVKSQYNAGVENASDAMKV